MPIPDYIDNEKHTLKSVLEQLIKDRQLNLDIATGFFRIEAWVELEEAMNRLTSLRLLIGRDPTIRPAESDRLDLLKYFRTDLREELNQKQFTLSYKQQIDRIIAYLEQEHIQVRLYGATTGEFLHAKAYIFDAYSIVGSSNFTVPGIIKNKELNIVNKIEAIARDLKENWFENFWNDSSVDLDYKTKLIQALNASKFGSKAYTPYQVFLKALYELFKDDSIVGDGEQTTLELASFQQEGFERALKLLERHNGCMVADAVGLGKTYIGLRVIDYYLIKLRRPRYVPKALVLCPAQLRDLVWRKKLDEFGLKADVISHEEMGRSEFDRTKYRNYDLMVIDESHNFRNSATNRYANLTKLLGGGKRYKRVLLLTATPINNSLFDLYHQILLLTRNNDTYYREWGINNLKTYFQNLVKGKDEITTLLFQTMVRRSRQDVIKRLEAGEDIRIAGQLIRFPKRELKNFTYNFEESFAGLYIGIADIIDQLNIAPYNIKSYKKRLGKTEQIEVERNRALVALQKTLYFKRFESSLIAFENTVSNQAQFQTRFYQMLTQENKLLDSTNFRKFLLATQLDDGEDVLVDIMDNLEDINPAGYDIGKLTEAIEADIQKLNDILERLQKIHQSVEAGEDSDRKLIAFKDLLLTLKNQKILVFSYFKDTATYIHAQLKNDKDWCEAMGNPTIDLITGNTPGKQREIKVKHFAPKANTESEEEREAIMLGIAGAIAQDPIDILICTDVLSEGQNLQDAGILVNYDLHWNPVRMIQRAGRIDRLGTDYEKLYIYNCFPEEGLESLLHLVERLQKRIADIDNNVGLDASVLGEEISNRSLEELQRLKQADTEAEKQVILEELEQISDLVSLDEMRLPLLEFMQRIGQEVVSEIPMGIHSTKYLTINDPQYREGGVFLAFKASDRHFWHFYPRKEGQICLDANLLMNDMRKIFNWLKCRESDFPPPDTLASVSFDSSIFDVVQGATENLLQYFQRQSTGSKLKPKLTGILQKIYQVLIQTTFGTESTSDEQETKDRVLQVLENRELQSYKRETKQVWEDYRNHQNENALLYKLDELLIENELYQDLDAPNLESIRKVIKAEDIQLVCYEWFYPET